MKFGICNEIFQGWTLERTLMRAKQAGYDVVEIAPFTLAGTVEEVSASQRREIRALAERCEVGIAGLHWVLVGTEGKHLTHPDAGVRRATAAYLVELVRCCADLGGDRMVVGSPKQRSRLEGVLPEQAWEYAREVFGDAVRCAEDRGVVICFEPLAPAETDFVNTAAEGLRFAESFQSPAMSIILDVKAMYSEGRPIPEIIRESAGRFAYFHANDPNLKGPGFGDMDFRPIAQALREVGYEGVVSVEVFRFEEGAERIADESRAYLREVFEC